VLVVYNNNEENAQFAATSQAVAGYYGNARGIPTGNLLALPSAPFTEYASQSEYVNYIATPISNYLSQHPEITVIVLCYGVPCQISVPAPEWHHSVDSALMLLGNPNVLSVTHWGLDLANPFYGSSVDWDTFRDSPANHITVGGQTWKVNYLVTRLDGYSTPTTAVTIDQTEYHIPTRVKDIIDRATRANAAGRAGLSDAVAVLDDAPGPYDFRRFPAPPRPKVSLPTPPN
jgi:uncharacterized protein (TIGR03790 family)